MKIPLSWLATFVALPSLDELTKTMDDLGLVVEGIEHIGEGLEDVVVVRIDAINAIEGADRVRLVTVQTADGPLDIVCGATNFALGNHVPLAPVGAVLPGGFEIAQRKMRGVVSNGMLCSARELRLSDDHEGLMLLDERITPVIGQKLTEALNVSADVVLDISIEGNRPDAWSIAGVARDLATRWNVPLQSPSIATPDGQAHTSSLVSASIDTPELCGRLTVSVLTGVQVGPSPDWVAKRLTMAGMRPISNVVDASNLVMLELGQPTHPYDLDRVARGHLGVRAARPGESLRTLDDVERPLAQPGRGLGDAGADCVIVDGDDRVIGLAGIMGGASSEISETTSTVLLEAAYFDPMTIARASKRHGLRSEASNRFERGVDPTLALTATGRFVAVLRESCPNLSWLAAPLDVAGDVPTLPEIEIREHDIERALGVSLDNDEVRRILQGLDFSLRGDLPLFVTPPARRLDVRHGAAGRADVIEEIARLYSYARLPRRTPTWPQPGGLTPTQRARRRLRDVLVDLGVSEAWTPTLGSDDDFDVLAPGVARVRITNPLASEESVLRATLLTGLVRAWGRNAERGLANSVLGEIGTVFTHPDVASAPRQTRGGAGGTLSLTLPSENERATIVFGREGDDARTAVAFWTALSARLGLRDVQVHSQDEVAPGFHPTRGATITTAAGVQLGVVGEVDPDVVRQLTTSTARRLGALDLDLDALFAAVLERQADAHVTVPSRFPVAAMDLAFVTPQDVAAADVARALRGASDLVEEVELFDVYRDEALTPGGRSLTFAVRLVAPDRTLSEADIASARQQLLESAAALGAVLRS